MSRKEFRVLNKIVLTVGSATYAIKARKLLLRVGIDAKNVKLAADNSLGCTHGIEISESDMFAAAAALIEAGVSYKVYRGGIEQ